MFWVLTSARMSQRTSTPLEDQHTQVTCIRVAFDSDEFSVDPYPIIAENLSLPDFPLWPIASSSPAGPDLATKRIPGHQPTRKRARSRGARIRGRTQIHGDRGQADGQLGRSRWKRELKTTLARTTRDANMLRQGRLQECTERWYVRLRGGCGEKTGERAMIFLHNFEGNAERLCERGVLLWVGIFTGDNRIIGQARVKSTWTSQYDIVNLRHI